MFRMHINDEGQSASVAHAATAAPSVGTKYPMMTTPFQVTYETLAREVLAPCSVLSLEALNAVISASMKRRNG